MPDAASRNALIIVLPPLWISFGAIVRDSRGLVLKSDDPAPALSRRWRVHGDTAARLPNSPLWRRVAQPGCLDPLPHPDDPAPAPSRRLPARDEIAARLPRSPPCP